MGFTLKVEGPNLIELGTTSITSVVNSGRISPMIPTRSTDLGSTVVITGKILTAVDGGSI